MGKRLVVACDLDDVLFDFISRFIEISRALVGKPVDPDALPVDWGWSNFNMTQEEMAACFLECSNQFNFHEHLDMVKGVDPMLVRLLHDATTMVFPTARFATRGAPVAHQSARALRNQYGIEYPTVIVGDNKGPLAGALEYDYFIDDRPKNVLEVKAARPECKVFLADSCHNRGTGTMTVLGGKGIPRIDGFNDFAKRVLEAA
jgi:hypothetical protein